VSILRKKLRPGVRAHVDVKHSLSSKQRLEVVGSYVARQARLWYRFKVSFLFSIISMFIAITIWYFFNFIFGASGSEAVQAAGFGASYFNFVLVGVIINQYILITLTTYLSTIREAYWQNRLEIYLMSPGRLETYFTSGIIWTYLYATINVIFYFGIGILLFGAQLTITLAGLLTIVVILFLLIVALSGVGLISASMFFLTESKGDVEPISWFMTTITGLLAGVFFPVEIFKDQMPILYTLSRFLPQTHVIQGIRQVMLNGMWLGDYEIVQIVMYLGVAAAILFPLGLAMFKHGIRKGEKEGKLARWN